jgi:hypothetical protein
MEPLTLNFVDLEPIRPIEAGDIVHWKGERLCVIATSDHASGRTVLCCTCVADGRDVTPFADEVDTIIRRRAIR